MPPTDVAAPPALPAPSHLRRDVETLATTAGRRIGDPGHEAARNFLRGRLGELGLSPYAGTSFELPYDTAHHGRRTNLVGLLPGRDPSLPPVLLGAHYDTCGVQPGADDNAAAVAAVLAAVPSLRAAKLQRAVVVALFDAEEPPLYLTDDMGSTRFYEQQRTGPIGAAIVLDLVGHRVPVPGVEDLLFALGAESGPDVAAAVRAAAAPTGVRVLPVPHHHAPDLSDHAVFRREGRQFLFLSCGHGPDYHEVTDTADKVDWEKLAAVSGYVTALVRGLDGKLLGPAAPQDTTALEVERWKACWTPVGLPPELSSAPLDRAQIDAMVRRIVRHFGM